MIHGNAMLARRAFNIRRSSMKLLTPSAWHCGRIVRLIAHDLVSCLYVQRYSATKPCCLLDRSSLQHYNSALKSLLRVIVTLPACHCSCIFCTWQRQCRRPMLCMRRCGPRCGSRLRRETGQRTLKTGTRARSPSPPRSGGTPSANDSADPCIAARSVNRRDWASRHTTASVRRRRARAKAGRVCRWASSPRSPPCTKQQGRCRVPTWSRVELARCGD